jgi:KaiC/GvpD/RAD55 family RecA-like ATPase
LIAADHHVEFTGEITPSGVNEPDAPLSGGPLRGSSTLVTGPAGSGKTTIALQCLNAACRRGEKCTVYEFDERIGTLLARPRRSALSSNSISTQVSLFFSRSIPQRSRPASLFRVYAKRSKVAACA